MITPLGQHNPSRPNVTQDSSSSLAAELNKAAARARQVANAHKAASSQLPSIVPDPNMNTHNIRHAASQNTSRTVSSTSAHSLPLSSSTPATLAGLSDQQKRMKE